MIYIAHRANYIGKNLSTENSINQITYCLSLGVDVEIDVWYVENSWWLGHDKPQYPINEQFLFNNNLWCHAKNNDAFFQMVNQKNIHCFWHETDAYTLTSRGYIWAYPGSKLNNQSICVLPEKYSYTIDEIQHCAGICSDEIEKYLI